MPPYPPPQAGEETSALAFVNAAARAGLVDHDLAELRQLRLGLLPDPARQVLAGRILEARDLVQVVMIELIVDRLKSHAHVREIHDPAAVLVHCSAQVQLDPERMPVQPSALVSRRYVGQPVCGLDGEYSKDVHGCHYG